MAKLQLSVFTAALLAAVAIPGAAASPSCGDILTASVTLIADLACDGPALFIGADDVTVELAGHTISGPGEFFGIASFGVDRATVLGPGSIKEFAIPVYFEGGSGHLARGVTATATLQAFVLDGSIASTIQGNTARPAVADANMGVWIRGAAASDNQVLYNDAEGFGIGVGVTEGGFNTIAENYLRANLNGVSLQGTKRNVVQNNTLVGNQRGVWVTILHGDEPPASKRNRILSNRIFESLEAGILLDGNSLGLVNPENLLQGNVVRGAQRGIWIEETNSATVVRGNVVFDQTVAHIDDDGAGTVLDGNVCWPGSC